MEDFQKQLNEFSNEVRHRQQLPDPPPMQIWVTGWWHSKEFTDFVEAQAYYDKIGRHMKIWIVLYTTAIVALFASIILL